MGKIALLFAGQGSQYPGMGADIYEHSPAAKAAFDKVEALRPGTMTQCFSGTKEELSITANTQPCMFITDYGIAKAVEAQGVSIEGAAGFSLGEIPALAFSGMLSLEEAFQLVCYRAEVMHHAAEANPGGMQAVLKLDADTINRLAEGFTDVFPVNYNSPEQTAVAGNPEQLKAFAAAVKEAGGRAVPLAVSGAFHSPYMNTAAEKMAARAESLAFEAGTLPVYANRTAAPYRVETAKELLASQVNHPVQWVKTIQQMIADGFDCFIEVGPGKTLSGLVKKISTDAKVCKVENLEDLQALQEFLQQCI